MKKKTVSAILASVMCISMLFGCSVSTDTGDASSNEESTEETDASAGDVTERPCDDRLQRSNRPF